MFGKTSKLPVSLLCLINFEPIKKKNFSRLLEGVELFA